MGYRLREIKIELSYVCTLSCIHCSSDAGQNCHNEISKDVCLRLIDEAAHMGVEKISFSGGEPLLCNYLENVVSRANDYDITTVVYSSGNFENINGKLLKLKNKGLKKVVFSLFGANENTHEKITLTSGSFSNSINAISASISIGLKTEIHFVPLTMNYQEIDSLAKLSRKLMVEKTSVLRLVPQGRGKSLEGQILDNSKNLKLKEQITKLRNENHNIRTGSPYNFLMRKGQPKCTAGIDKLTICPDLRIYPCDAFKQITAEDIIGDTRFSDLNDNSLNDCWHNSIYLNAVRDTLSASYEEPCLACSDLDSCQSGCLAQKILYYGKLTKRPDPLCLKRKENAIS